MNLYTDGSVRGTSGGWAVMAQLGPDDYKLVARGRDYPVNVVEMELRAVVEAMASVHRSRARFAMSKATVVIHSDSAIVLNCIRDGEPERWARNGWHMSDGVTPVKHEGLWQRFLTLKREIANTGIPLSFHKVAAHSGVRGNELADMAANGQARECWERGHKRRSRH